MQFYGGNNVRDNIEEPSLFGSEYLLFQVNMRTSHAKIADG